MKVICVILCLIISTSVPAYAESMLWSTKHSSTSLEKDQEWISEQLLSEQSVTAMEAIEDIDGDIEDPEDSEEFIEIIDATLVMEGTEAVPLEITMDPTTPNDIRKQIIPILKLSTIFDDPFASTSIEHFDHVGMKRKRSEARFHAYGWMAASYYMNLSFQNISD